MPQVTPFAANYVEYQCGHGRRSSCRRWRDASCRWRSPTRMRLCVWAMMNPPLCELSQHGVQSQVTGCSRIPKEKVTAGDVAKAVGFTSSKIARQREASYAAGRAETAVADAKSAF
jgi:hypothetical protein